MFEKATPLWILLSVAFALPTPDAKVTSQHSAHQVTVTTPQGEVLGSLLTSRLGKPIYSFRGIRYAKAPVNELRFQVNKFQNYLLYITIIIIIQY